MEVTYERDYGSFVWPGWGNARGMRGRDAGDEWGCQWRGEERLLTG